MDSGDEEGDVRQKTVKENRYDKGEIKWDRVKITHDTVKTKTKTKPKTKTKK